MHASHCLRRQGVPRRVLSPFLLLAAFLWGGVTARAGTHYLDLRPAYLVQGKIAESCFRLGKGCMASLVLRDSEGHNCAIFGVDQLNPLYSNPPSGYGKVTFDPICTELGDHTVTGFCLETLEYVPMNIRVLDIMLDHGTETGGPFEMLQYTNQSFWASDFQGHYCAIFGFDNLNPIYGEEPPYVPSGVGGAAGEAYVTELGTRSLSAVCLETYADDPLAVQVFDVDLKPDFGEQGFVQTVKDGVVMLQLNVLDGHHCAIFGLNDLNPMYDGVVPDGYGSVSFAAVCTVPGAQDLMGYDFETAGEDWTLIRVSAMTETKWEAAGSPLDDNPCDLGGGKRIFPEWLESDLPYGPYPADRRAWVKVVSTVDPMPTDLNQPIAVRFGYYDVDDPTANEPPVDDEANVTDNRGDGQDHWQTGAPKTAEDVPVTGQGQAAPILVVSQQPGDNFRVNAQLGVGMTGATRYTLFAPQNVTDGRLQRTDGLAIPAPEIIEMLTVWRTVHLEKDSLGSPATAQMNPTWSEGTVIGTTYFPEAEATGLQIDGVPDGGGINDLYNKGGIRAGVFAPLGVFDYIHSSDHIGYAYVAGDHRYMQTAGYTMVDDDHDWTQIGPPLFPLRVQFPLTPDTSHLETTLRPGYIKPEFVTSEQQGLNQILAFGGEEWNLTPARMSALASEYCGLRQFAHDAYWCVYLLGGFQPAEAEDGDPDAEESCLGFAAAPKGAATFAETYRDLVVWMTDNGMAAKPYSWVIDHETGHLLGLGQAPYEGGHARKVLSRNGNLLTLKGQFRQLGFCYVGGMLETSWQEATFTEASKSRVTYYINDPVEDVCSVAVSPVSGEHEVGQYFRVYENSIMCGRFTLWNDGRFSPRDLNALRARSGSPIW